MIKVLLGYDWAHTTEIVKEEQTTVEVRVPVPAGKILQIKQGDGQCGQSDPKTELFKIVQIDGKTREIENTVYERTFKDGSVIVADHPMKLFSRK